jgi:predicted nuclease with TOPRIM domain
MTSNELLETLKAEITAIQRKQQEMNNQSSELEKALRLTRDESLRLEGRLLEVKGIVEYLELKQQEATPETVEDAQGEGETTTSDALGN